MSRRVMADGKTYDRSSVREVREYHTADPDPDRRYVCGRCGARIYRVKRRDGSQYLRHEPGTFWVAW